MSRFQSALADIATVFERFDSIGLDHMVEEIAAARRIAVHGVGREGLQMRGLGMRLFHLGLDVSIVGDMTTPPLAKGDLLVVSAGPGWLETVAAFMRVAREAGARVLLVTAEPGGRCAALADVVVHLPAQTMASDRGAAVTSTLPMGSVFEGAEFILFEVAVLHLRERLGVSAERMRANHTNLE